MNHTPNDGKRCNAGRLTCSSVQVPKAVQFALVGAVADKHRRQPCVTGRIAPLGGRSTSPNPLIFRRVPVLASTRE